MPKRILNKFRKKPAADEPKFERITNETVSQHREQVLAGGRKFKYPVQYAKHRLVINSILIFLGALFVTAAVVWWQLYSAQNTGAFFYRVTQLLPFAVARVDDEPALYRDYLLEYRSSVHWLEKKTQNFDPSSSDGKRQAEYFKRKSLNKAEEIAYVRTVAEKYNLAVSDQEIDAFINDALKSSQRKLSQKSYEAVLSDSYGVSNDEYRSIVKNALLKKKVSFKIDADAQQKITAAEKALKSGQTFEQVVAAYSDDEATKAANGDVGFVPIRNNDQGIVRTAAKLQPGQTSSIIKGANAYYIVKLIETQSDQARYAQIKVSLNKFSKEFTNLKKNGKIKEYIKVSTKE